MKTKPLKYQTLYDVWETFSNLMEFSTILMEFSTIEELIKLDPVELLELCVAAQKYIQAEINKLADILGLNSGIKRIKTRVYKFMCDFWGGCCQQGNIPRIDINLNLFTCNTTYFYLLHVLVHELCHIKILNHSEKFYRMVFSSLQLTGILDNNYEFEDVYEKTDLLSRPYTINRKMMFRNNATIVTLEIRKRAFCIWRNKLFNLKLREENARYIKKDYINELIRICNRYNISSSIFYIEP